MMKWEMTNDPAMSESIEQNRYRPAPPPTQAARGFWLRFVVIVVAVTTIYFGLACAAVYIAGNRCSGAAKGPTMASVITIHGCTK